MVNEGRKKQPAKVALTVIEANSHYDYLQCDDKLGTTETDCTVYENNHESEIYASIAKYAPYLTSEEKSSKRVQYLGSEGPS